MSRYFIIKTVVIVLITTVALYYFERNYGQRCALPEAGSFGKRCGNAFSNFVYDFQTLLTGLAAVGAAIVTVMATKVATDRQIKSQNYQVRSAIDFLVRNLGDAAKKVIENADSFIESVEIGHSRMRQNYMLHTLLRNLEDFRHAQKSINELRYQIYLDSEVEEALSDLSWHETQMRHIFQESETRVGSFGDLSWMETFNSGPWFLEQVRFVPPAFKRFVTTLESWEKKKKLGLG